MPGKCALFGGGLRGILEKTAFRCFLTQEEPGFEQAHLSPHSLSHKLYHVFILVLGDEAFLGTALLSQQSHRGEQKNRTHLSDSGEPEENENE